MRLRESSAVLVTAGVSPEYKCVIPPTSDQQESTWDGSFDIRALCERWRTRHHPKRLAWCNFRRLPVPVKSEGGGDDGQRQTPRLGSLSQRTAIVPSPWSPPTAATSSLRADHVDVDASGCLLILRPHPGA